MDRPSVYSFLDYRAYLDAWFEWKKQENPRYSYRLFSRVVRQKSPSFLKDVISRRKSLTGPQLTPVLEALELDAEEAPYFELLVAFESAKDPNLRDEAWDKIAATRRFHQAHRLEGPSYKYVSRWYYPAIRELAAHPDFRDDAAWVAARTRPKITEQQAQEALDVLFELGMLERTEEGIVRADGSIVTPREVLGRAVHDFHRDVLSLAATSIESTAPADRHLVAVTAAVPAKLLPELKREMSDFAARLNDLCEGAGGTPDRVLAFELALFPVASVEDA